MTESFYSQLLARLLYKNKQVVTEMDSCEKGFSLDLIFKTKNDLQRLYFDTLSDMHEFLKTQYKNNTELKFVRGYIKGQEDVKYKDSGYGILNGDSSGFECYITNKTY